MPSEIYKQIIIDRITSFIKESKSVDLISHLGLRGEIRESGLGKLILDLLPVDWGLGNGKIIDSNNNQSSETDLIIYYKRVFPPIFFSEKVGLFPLETCGFAFEIKTKSTAKEIKTTIKKFCKLREMEIIERWSEVEPEYNIKPIRAYFAIDTDLKQKDEFERYKKLDKDYLVNPAIQILCVVGKGVWFHRPEKEDLNPHWDYFPSDGNHKELIILFSTIINQLISIVTGGGLDMRRYWLDILEIIKREVKQ